MVRLVKNTEKVNIILHNYKNLNKNIMIKIHYNINNVKMDKYYINSKNIKIKNLVKYNVHH